MSLVATMTLGERLRQLRLAAGLTQQALAVKADLAVSNIVHLEGGRIQDPRLGTMKAIADALGCKVDDFFTEETSRAESRQPRRHRGQKGRTP